MLSVFTKNNLLILRPQTSPLRKWVIPEKFPPPPPNGWGRFLTPPLSPRFPEAQDPPPVWISKTKEPPSRLDFREKNIRLKFNFFLIEIVHNHV